MKNIGKILVILMLVSLSACVQHGKQQKSAPVKRSFPTVSLPAMVQDPQEAAEYMAMHYWDAFLKPQEKDYISDSLYVSGVAISDLEQVLANYIYILDVLPLKTAQKAVSQLTAKVQAYESADTSSNVFETFIRLTDKYLFDPNSPLRDEDLYSPIAASLSGSQHLDSATRDRYSYVAKMCRLNEKGSKAADFRFCDKKGREYRLYDIKADKILLFFSNPGCQSCLEIINAIKENKDVADMISSGSLAVLNIYIDEDLKEWREYMPIYPENWYNGFDPDLVIRTDKTYNVRAIPSLYLLDADKTVMLKDTTPERLFHLLLNS
jgi:thioredoxin-related protein